MRNEWLRPLRGTVVLIMLGVSFWPLRLAAQQARADSTLSLSPGDLLRITVWRQAELSGEFLIADDGTITHPLYRELKVTGLPLPTVEDRVRAFLSRFENSPAFVMTPLFRVVVAGEVRAPQVYTVPPGTSVAQVVALAGGMTDRGRLDQVRVLRRTQVFMVDLTRPTEGAQLIVRSGDQIVVGRRRNILQDVVGPSSAVIGAAAALASIIIQLRR